MPTIPYEIERLNKLLQEHFGIDTSTGQELWRVVWSQDQFEKRLMDVTDEGLDLLYPEVRLVPKYRQWIQNKWVLERLTIVPSINESELPVSKLSYEPMMPFQNEKGETILPTFEACKFIVDLIHSAQDMGGMAKYKEPSKEESLEAQKVRIDKLQEEIFGNETDVSDHLTRQTGIVITDDSFRIKEN